MSDKKYFIREWREHAGLTQKQVAERMGRSEAWMSRIESGHRRCTVRFLERFQRVVKCPHVWTPLARPPDKRDEAQP